MSILCTGRNGTVYTLKEPYFGHGGEGNVYEINGKPNLVAKLYHNGKGKGDEQKKRKILTMLAGLPSYARNQIAWPVDILSVGGIFAGFVMPRIDKTSPISMLYSPDDIDSIKLSDKIVLARNLCTVVNAVHEINQVCGDLNPNNIAVDPDNGRITLLDTDSFHITDYARRKVYRCEVGMPEYLAPELHRKLQNGGNFKTAPLPTYTKETDLFALAVHIFKLLMNGCHPFTAAADIPSGSFATSVVCPQPVKNIRDGRCLFFKDYPGLKIPVYAPEFDILPPKIQKLFHAAFDRGLNNPGERPTAEEWYEALTEYGKKLKECRINSVHQYDTHLKSCPWCRINERTAQKLPLNGGHSRHGGQASIPSNTSFAAPMPQPITFWNKSGTFWFITALALIAVISFDFKIGNSLFAAVGEIGDLASFTGIVGAFSDIGGGLMAVCGIIGWLFYNFRAHPDYGIYTMKHYFLSVLTTIGFSAAAAFLPITAALLILAAVIGIVAFIISLF